MIRVREKQFRFPLQNQQISIIPGEIMDIEELRDQIDKIDSEIVRLYTERMAVSSQIADYKRENNLPARGGSRTAALQSVFFSESGR